jgi:biopolymer transport protein TolR
MPKVHNTGGGNGGARRGRGAFVATSLAEINVVPLVDVMLVLLIIFMVTAPMMQQGLQVNLPQARRASPVNAQPIYVTIPADFSRSRRVQLGTEFVSIEFLGERLKQAMLERDDKSIFIRPDAKATMQDFTTVVETLTQAGITKVGFMTKPIEGR